ncbi:hypothetical protein PSENEW3n2_00001805 [Picochlorum sp. SENEW3]|nr:hypothetical protein PSENEW3n2_00001805 [Picochlorum sp. SENEW3]WPT14575.1 hypothetical protein PSENEW3_00001805 [Picochlorum sp. SENEW3]
MDKPCVFEATFPVESEETAELLLSALSVDKEVKQNLARKELIVDGRNLRVSIAAVDAGTLRSATCAFLQTLQFALEIKSAFT